MPTFPPERPSVWNFRPKPTPKAGPSFMAIWMWIAVVFLSCIAIRAAIWLSGGLK